MNVGQAIKKLLTHYLVEQVLMHLAHEMEQEANHYETVGAPLRAAYIRSQVEVLREAEKALSNLPYPQRVKP
jgi:hypothetical protein